MALFPHPWSELSRIIFLQGRSIKNVHSLEWFDDITTLLANWYFDDIEEFEFAAQYAADHLKEYTELNYLGWDRYQLGESTDKWISDMDKVLEALSLSLIHI